MKIMYVDLQYDYGMKERGLNNIAEFGFVNVFRSLGHEVQPFYYDDYLNKTSELQVKLKDAADAAKPDLILFMLFKDQFSFETLAYLKSKYVTANWFGDDHWRFDSFTSKFSPYFTYSITTDHFSIHKYKKIGVKNPILSQWAALDNGNTYSNNEVKVDYKYDVSFVGGSHSVRRWFISELEKSGIKVAKFGFGWPGGAIEYSEIQRIFRETKINLNLSNSITYDLRYLTHNIKNPMVAYTAEKDVSQIKARNFEIPYYGGFQLTDYVPSLESYFQIGKEVSCYRDVDEAKMLIRYYLENADEREAVKQAGIIKARSCHGYIHRHKEIIDKILAYEKINFTR